MHRAIVAGARLPKAVFREYDIRGKIAEDLAIDAMYDLGMALAAYLCRKNPALRSVAIGIDGRTHSPAIKDELTRALLASGLDVTFIGLCTSPVLYFAMHTQVYDAGIMVTASHNPKEYNGLKLCLGKKSLWGADLQELYHAYEHGAKREGFPAGSYQERLMVPLYVAWISEHFAHLRGMNLAAVIDCGNGAGGAVIPLLVQAMGWKQVQVLFPEVDGSYPNHEADPVCSKNMQDVKRVLETSAISIGIGLDGDADRMAPMTKSGVLVSGDRLLGLFARFAGLPQGSSVVCDIKSSTVLLEYLTSLGLQPVLSPSGHSIIKDVMQKVHAPIGGELSCHFFFHDRYFGYDDGIYAMMRLFEIAQLHSLDDLLKVYPIIYTSQEYRVACREDQKLLIVQTVKDIFAQKERAECNTIDGIRATLPYGWGLLRASNTQAVLSLRFESTTPEGLIHIKNDFIDALRPFYDVEQMQKIFSAEST